MNYLQLWLWYLLSALIMSVIYCGLERASGKIGFTAKSIMCSWSIISLVVAVMLFGLQTFWDKTGKFPPMQISGATLGASCVTLIISSCCVHCAS
jgi:hypothetical protein